MSASVGELQLSAERTLSAAGVENARFDVRLLLCHVLACELQTLIAYPEKTLSDDQHQAFEALLKRRQSREPMSHILGMREFWSLPFKVTADTLTPRPDSETLIEAVLDHFPEKQAELRVADLGVGTGCLLLSVLSEYENAQGLGIDQSARALRVAQENAVHLGLSERARFAENNWLDDIEDAFDVILCNPPYIPLVDENNLEAEVREFEPHSALFAGADGLDDYRKLARQFAKNLKTGGKVFLEIGVHQGNAVGALMESHDLRLLDRPKDLAGIERCLILQNIRDNM